MSRQTGEKKRINERERRFSARMIFQHRSK